MTSPLSLHAPGYIDYYDHWFDTPSPTTPVWNRNGRDFPSRREGFRSMADVGLRCVDNGPVGHLASRYGILRSITTVVVYTDEQAHSGEGKVLCKLSEASVEHPDRWASIYVAPPDFGHPPAVALSRRYLRVGELGFVLRYVGGDDWRSNVGTTEMLVEGPLGEAEHAALGRLMRRYRTPLIAVDLVPTSETNWLATDLNLAPGLRGSGIEDKLPARQAADLIRHSFYELHRQAA